MASQATAARDAALQTMRAIRSGELADRAFARSVVGVSDRDRAFAHELVYGTLRLRGRLDFILEKFVKRGLAALDDDVLDVLRLGAYQILEMRSVPAYAAVSQSVELAKKLRNRGASGFVNGVLQSVRRAGEITEPPLPDVAERLSEWGSHPRWLVERWIEQYGAGSAELLVAANNVKPVTYIRPVGISLDEAIVRAAERGVALERVLHAPDSLRIDRGSVLQAIDAVPSVVQDPAASLIARYAAPTGGVIADLCAAPGGKAIALAVDIGDRGVVVAGDVAARRLGRAVENATRIGGLSIQFVTADARNPPLAEADMVLVDAPCTGTGTFRRHPDGKWRLRPADMNALVDLQRQILDGASKIVKVGGILLYSTCSLEREENEEQVTAFLDHHPNFLRRPPAAWEDSSTMDEVGNLIVLPQRHGFDGAFGARLERIS